MLFATQRAGRAGTMAQAQPLLAPAGLGGLLSAYPRAGLGALNRSAIALDEQPGMLISSGLVLGDFSMRAPVPGGRRVPWLGALAALSDVVKDGVNRRPVQLSACHRRPGLAGYRGYRSGHYFTVGLY